MTLKTMEEMMKRWVGIDHGATGAIPKGWRQTGAVRYQKGDGLMENRTTKGHLFIDVLELMNQKEKVMVVVEDGYVGFPEYSYWIKLSRIRSYRKLVAFVAHLLEKDWVTSEMLLRFIEKVAHYNKLNIYGC